MNHPYIGLHGTIRAYPYIGDNAGTNDYTGTVVAVCQGGTTAKEDEAAYCAVIILRDTPDLNGRAHAESDIWNFVPDDPTEARRRLTEQK